MATNFVTEVHVTGTYFKGTIQFVGAVAGKPEALPPVADVPAHYKLFLNATKASAFLQADVEALQLELLDIVNKVAELNNDLPPVTP